MYLWLQIFLLSAGVTARLVIPAATAGSGLNLLVVLFIWLALLVHLLDKSRLPAPTLPSFMKLLLFLFGALILASFINAPYKFGAFQYLMAWISDIVLFSLVYSLCVRNAEYITTLLSVFLATGLVVVFYGLYQHLWELRSLAEQVRLSPSLLDVMPDYLKDAALARAIAGEPYATFLYQNSLGAFLALIIPVFITLAFARQKRWWIGFIVLLIFLFVLIQTGSKGAILAFILGAGIAGIIYYFSKVPSNKRGFRGVLLLAGVIIAIVVLIIVSYAQMSDSLNVRLGYWDATVKIIKDNSISGVGLNQFGNSYLYYKSAEAGEVQKAHNDYLQIASEIGIPALLVFLAIWLIILRSISRPVRELNPQSTIHNPPSSVFPYILGSGFAFLISEIFQTSLIALDIPILSTVIIFILWLGAFKFFMLYLDSRFSYGTSINKNPVRGRGNDNMGLGWLRIGLFAGLLAFLIHCLVDFNLYVQGLSMSVWFVGAVFLSISKTDKVIEQTQTKISNALAKTYIVFILIIILLLVITTTRLIQYETLLEEGKAMCRISVREEHVSAPEYLGKAYKYNHFSVDVLLELAWDEHNILCPCTEMCALGNKPSCLSRIEEAISLNPLNPMLYYHQWLLYQRHAETLYGCDKSIRTPTDEGGKVIPLMDIADRYRQKAEESFKMVKELYPTWKQQD